MRLCLAHAALLAMVMCPSLALARGKKAASPDQAAPPGAVEAPAAADAATAQPSSGPKVLAVVGGTAITQKQVDDLLSRFIDIPPNDRPAIEQDALNRLIAVAMMHKFMLKEKVPVSDEELLMAKDEFFGKAAKAANMNVDQFMVNRGITMDSLRDQTCLRKLMTQETSQPKVDAFIKSNPDYFNGTRIHLKQIVVACRPLAATETQQKASARLGKLAQDIQAGKMTFEEAAKQYSEEHRSAREGGEVKEFSFGQVVPLPVAEAAFKLNPGQTSRIVRSDEGFHLLKLVSRQPGQAPPGDKATELAKAVLLSQINARLTGMAMDDCPIVIIPAYPDLLAPTKPAGEATSKPK